MKKFCRKSKLQTKLHVRIDGGQPKHPSRTLHFFRGKITKKKFFLIYVVDNFLQVSCDEKFFFHLSVSEFFI